MDPWDAYYEAQNANSSNANFNETNKYDEHEDRLNTNHHQDHHNDHANWIENVDTENNSNHCADTMPTIIPVDVSTLHANPPQNLCAANDQSHQSNELDQVQNTHTECHLHDHMQDAHDSHKALDQNEPMQVAHELNPTNGLTDQSQNEQILIINNNPIDDIPSDTNNDHSKQVRTDLIDIFFVSSSTFQAHYTATQRVTIH